MRAELSREEKLNVLTHGVMAAAFIIWMCIGVPQTWAAQGTVAGVGILIFFLCMICMFTASALYHAMPAGSAAKDVLHIFDHICIYLAIAGSYTPAVIAIMDGWMKIGLLVFQWGMVVIGIIIYLAFRFEWKYAVSAIIANLHDIVIILGFFAFFEWEFSLPVLAAILAILGYSVNESVIIFDRIRENFRKMRKASVMEVVNHAITSTTSRTIITHGCTQIMVLSMMIFGGPTLHNFALALTIGICFGIYSSVFVAAAVAMWLGIKREDLVKPVKEKGNADGAVV